MAEGMLPPVVAVLKGNVSDFKAKMGEARAEMGKTESKGSSSFKNVGKIAKAALLGIGVAAIGVGIESLKMADEYEKAHARLTAAIAASGSKFSSFSGLIDKQAKTFENLGYTNTQYEEGLARLTQATNNPAKALKNMALVANIARARNIDLVSASALVGKVMQGNTGVLKRFGIDLGLSTGGLAKQKTALVAVGKAQQKLTDIVAKMKSGHLKGAAAVLAYRNATQDLTAKQAKLHDTMNSGKEAIDALTKRFGGAAQAQAETFSGKILALKVKAEDLFKNIGLKLIPILEKLGEWLGKHVPEAIATLTKYIKSIVAWFQQHKVAVAALAAGLGALALVIVGALVQAFILWAVQAGVAAAMTLVAMAPVILFIAVLAALGAAVYEVVTHWQAIWSTIGPFVTAMWATITGAFNAAITWIRGIIAPFVEWWQSHWKQIQTIVMVVWRALVAYVQIQWAILKGILLVGLAVLSAAWNVAWQVMGSFLRITFAVIVATIKTGWDVISTIFRVARDVILGVVGVFIDLLTGKWGKAWDEIKSMASKVWSDITKGVASFGKDLISGILGFVSAVYDSARKIGDAIINGIKDAITGAAGAIGGALKGVLSHVPGAGVLSHVPLVGKLFGGANGGIRNFNPAGELAVLHGREAVLPLNNPQRAWELIHESGLTGGGAATGGGSTQIHGDINITIITPDPTKSGQAVAATLGGSGFLHGRN